ncbi:hypothetical protein ACYPKM_03485 [Pseudomonas aeruginosa]
MSWNITHDPIYAELLELELDKKYSNLAYRKKVLENLKWMAIDDGTDSFASKFKRVCRITVERRKGSEEVLDFLYTLAKKDPSNELDSLRYSLCMKIWSEALSGLTSGHDKFLDFKSYRKEHGMLPAWLSKESEYEQIRGVILTNPAILLSKRDLLRGEWARKAALPEYEDDVLLTLLLAFQRLTQWTEFRPYEMEYHERSIKPLQSLVDCFDRALKNGLQGFASRMSKRELSKSVRSLFDGLLDGTDSFRYTDHGLPRILLGSHNITPWFRSVQNLMLASGLYKTQKNQKKAEKFLGRNSETLDEELIFLVSSPYTSLPEIAMMAKSPRFGLRHTECVIERGLYSKFLDKLDSESFERLSAAGALPFQKGIGSKHKNALVARRFSL